MILDFVILVLSTYLLKINDPTQNMQPRWILGGRFCHGGILQVSYLRHCQTSRMEPFRDNN